MSIKSEVKQLLTDQKRFRDNRTELITNILQRKGIPFYKSHAAAILYREAASIDRSWRQVQEQNPELRGDDYDRRHNVLEPEKQKELGYNVVTEINKQMGL